jgi:hypothetical protein
MGRCKLVFVGKPPAAADIAANDTVTQHQIDLARFGFAETVRHTITPERGLRSNLAALLSLSII